MTQNLRFYIMATIIALVLSACTITSPPPTPGVVDPIPTTTPVPAMSMVVSYDTTNVYDAVDQEVNYIYVIGNTSTTPLPGPITVIDDRVTVTCPGVETVGNGDANLNVDETITCTGPYKITQLDLNAGSFANTATAYAGGNNSPTVTTTVTVAQTRALTLTVNADPVTYINVDEKIIYTYTVKNTGSVTISPALFPITDNKISVPINCGSDATSLAPGAEVSCSATYTITQADLNAGSVTNTATATDGTNTFGPATATVNRPGTGNQIQPSTTLVPGTTIPHTVVKGEWLWQIARCYGADPRQVVDANRGRVSDPAKLVAGMTVTVPNIGSERTLYGPQKGSDLVMSCAPLYAVQSGDTWENIAERFRASPSLLRKVNPSATLSLGNQIRIPFNSEGDN